MTTLTKKMAEDLSEYLANINIKVHYLHSDIKTLERMEILRDLRLGVYDVVVGINLLREGLDLPEVSLVAILDADKEGFLRSDTSLIQTIGRAARNVKGKVLMYADVITGSMRARHRRDRPPPHRSRSPTTRSTASRPTTIQKEIREVMRSERVAESRANYRISPDVEAEHLPINDLVLTLQEMEAEMKRASKALEFERAADIRDEIQRLKRLLPEARHAAGEEGAGPQPVRRLPAHSLVSPKAAHYRSVDRWVGTRRRCPPLSAYRWR